MFDVKIIETGYIMADGGAMFGAIPKRAWKRKYPSDEENLCPLAMRCLLAINSDRKILVDLGMGDKYLKQMAYYQPKFLVDIRTKLAEYNYSADDITDVVLSHLHFDHCGYATRINENEKIVPTFPNAKYWLSELQWNNLFNPNKLEKDSLLKDNILPINEAGILNLVKEDISIIKGFDLRIFEGHTHGQLVPFIQCKNETVTFPGDLIPTSAHVPLEWISAYDLSAETSVNEKLRFLNEAADNNYTLIYYHDAKTERSKVKRINDDFIASNKKGVRHPDF